MLGGKTGEKMSRSNPVRNRMCFVSLSDQFGGHEFMLLRWIEEVVRSGESPCLLVNSSATRLIKSIPEGCEVIQIPVLRGRGWRGKLGRRIDVARTFGIFTFLRAFKGVSVAVIAEGSLMAQSCATLGAKLAGLYTSVYCPLVDRFVDTGHADGIRTEARFMNRYRNLPDCWITLTRSQAEAFLAWSHTSQPIRILPNVLRREISLTGQRRAESRKTILVMGRLAKMHKGLDFIISFATSRASLFRNKDWLLKFVGEGIDGDELRRSAIEAGISDIVEFSGWSEPESVLSEADCLLLSSRFEGVPLVVLEAISVQMPVVCSNLPGTRSFVHPECLFEVGDMEDAFNKIERVLDDPVFRAAATRWNAKQLELNASDTVFAQAVRSLSAYLRDQTLARVARVPRHKSSQP